MYFVDNFNSLKLRSKVTKYFILAVLFVKFHQGSGNDRKLNIMSYNDSLQKEWGTPPPAHLLPNLL